MAWRAPRFMLLHELRRAGSAAVTVTDEAAGFPKYRLFDDRAGDVFKFNTSSSSHTIIVDRGADFASHDAIDRLYIPDGHNLTGTLDMDQDDNSGFTSPTTLISGTAAIPASGPVDVDLSFPSTQRYVRVQFLGTGQWEIPELILTKTLTTSRGPDPEWSYVPEESALHSDKSSGATAHLLLGPDRGRWRLEYRFSSDSDDRTLFERVLAHPTTAPFLLDPPYDDRSPLWVTLTERRRRNDHPNPAGVADEHSAYTFEVLAHVS